MTKTATRKPPILWIVARHLDRITAIEQQSFDDPWDERAFHTMFRHPQVRGFAIEQDDMAAGYAIVSTLGEVIKINRLAVHAAYRRSKIGTALVERVKWMVESRSRRQAVVAITPLNNLDALAFFARLGFLARHGWVDGDGEDQINMEWVK